MEERIIMTKGELLKEIESFKDDTPIFIKSKVVLPSDGDGEKYIMITHQLTRPIERLNGNIILFAE